MAKSYAQNILCYGLKMMPVTDYIKYTQDPRDGLVGEVLPWEPGSLSSILESKSEQRGKTDSSKLSFNPHTCTMAHASTLTDTKTIWNMCVC